MQSADQNLDAESTTSTETFSGLDDDDANDAAAVPTSSTASIPSAPVSASRNVSNNNNINTTNTSGASGLPVAEARRRTRSESPSDNNLGSTAPPGASVQRPPSALTVCSRDGSRHLPSAAAHQQQQQNGNNGNVGSLPNGNRANVDGSYTNAQPPTAAQETATSNLQQQQSASLNVPVSETQEISSFNASSVNNNNQNSSPAQAASATTVVQREGSCNEHHQQDASKTPTSIPEIAEQNNAAAAPNAASLSTNENVANQQSSASHQGAANAQQRRFGKFRLRRHGSCLAKGNEDLRMKDVGSVCESLNPTKIRKVAAASPTSAALEQQRPASTAVAAPASASVADGTKAVSGKKRSSEKSSVGDVSSKNKNKNKKHNSSFCSFKKSQCLKKSKSKKPKNPKYKNTIKNANFFLLNEFLIFNPSVWRTGEVSSASRTVEKHRDGGSKPEM